MNNPIIKKLIVAIMLILSPLAMLAILGLIYVIVHMVNGLGFATAVSSFAAFVKSLTPYFSHLTVVPIILIVLNLILKAKGSVRPKR